MAFGSGSSLGKDRWTRRSGFPSSLQLLRVGKATLLHQHSSKKPTAPRDGAQRGESVGRGVFFLSYKGSGEVIQRFARCHLTPRRRESVARMVSPETRLCVIRSSKATSAAIESVQRLVSRPNSLGERCSSPLKASALSSSKASRVRRGREDLAIRASTPLALKSWMASRTVCWPQPRF